MLAAWTKTDPHGISRLTIRLKRSTKWSRWREGYSRFPRNASTQWLKRQSGHANQNASEDRNVIRFAFLTLLLGCNSFVLASDPTSQPTARASTQPATQRASTRPAIPVELFTFIQRLPSEARPDGKGTWSKFAEDKAADWINDHAPGTAIAESLTFDSVVTMKSDDRDEKTWTFTIQSEPKTRTIFGVPCVAHFLLGDDGKQGDLSFTSDAATAKKISGWKQGKSFGIHAIIDHIEFSAQPERVILRDSTGRKIDKAQAYFRVFLKSCKLDGIMQ